MNAHYAGGVYNYLNSRPNHTKNLAHLCNLFLRFGKFSPQICESCAVELWCNLMTELWNLCCVEKHIQSSNWRREKRPNRSVFGDAILPLRKWRKLAVRNLAVCCGAMWLHREKWQYGYTTAVPQVHQSLKDILENLFPVWLLGRTTCSFRSVFGLTVWSLTIAVSAI